MKQLKSMKRKKIIFLLSVFSLLMFLNSCAKKSSSRAKASSDQSNDEVVEESSEELSNFVIGQKDFRYGIAYNASANSSSINGASSAIKIGSLYYISDSANNRINVYSSLGAEALFHIGQDDSTSSLKNKGGEVGRDTLSEVQQIVSNGTNLVAADASNNRVLIWNTAPTSIDDLPDTVLGQNDFTSNEASTSGMNLPFGVTIVGTKLVVADTFNNRLLIWNTLPATSGTAPDLIYGQDNTTANRANRGGSTAANSLSFPINLDSDGSKLVVADYLNNRALVFSSVPSAHDTNSDAVFCQANFTSNSSGTTQSSCFGTAGVKIVGSSLYIADQVNNRMLYFNSIPDSGSAGNANGVFGQVDFTSGGQNAGGDVSASSLFFPNIISYVDSKLLLADLFNYRILIFDNPPTQVGTDSADSVLGQDNLSNSFINKKPVSESGFLAAMCIDMNDEYVLVGDRVNSRLLIYDKANIENGPIRVLGQSNFTDSCDYDDCGAPTASNFRQVEGGCIIDSENRIIVSDRYRNRVLIWSSFPTENGADADLVLGQVDFVSSGANSTGMDTAENGLKSLSGPMGLALDGDRLFVTDMGNNRILAYEYPISESNQPAIMYIGQPDEITSSSGTAQNKFHMPMGISVSDNKLIVTEYANARALVFDPVPATSNPDASYVLGQQDFVTDKSGLARNRMSESNQTMRSAVIDGVLYIPERQNNRILGFKVSDLASGMNADYLVGQSAWDEKSFDKLGNSDGSMYSNLYGPTAVMEDPNGKYVWIVESYSHRVMRVKKEDFLASRNQPL